MLGGVIGAKVVAVIVAGSILAIGVQEFRVQRLKLLMSRAETAQAEAYAEAVTEAVRLAREDEKTRGDLTTIAAVNAAIANRQIEYVTNTIIERIPSEAITPDIDDLFVVPRGLVRVHDAAASGNPLVYLPLPAGESNDSSSGISMSRVGAVLANNYGSTCRLNAQQLNDLIAWIREQQAVTPPEIER